MRLGFQLFSMMLAATPGRAFGEGLGAYLSKYQVGIDYAASQDSVRASYEMGALGVPAADNCVVDAQNPLKQRCSVGMVAGGSDGFGLFLQQAFKRQGNWHFDYDVGFGARYLEGKLDKESLAEGAEAGSPLRSLSFGLAAIVVKPYVTVGFTPMNFPELLLSLGPAAQIAVGTVKLNGQPERVAIATASSGLIGGYGELELVFVRFGEGALSLFSQQDFSGGQGTPFYPKEKDGIRDVRAVFSRNVSGLKLVTPWP